MPPRLEQAGGGWRHKRAPSGAPGACVRWPAVVCRPRTSVYVVWLYAAGASMYSAIVRPLHTEQRRLRSVWMACWTGGPRVVPGGARRPSHAGPGATRSRRGSGRTRSSAVRLGRWRSRARWPPSDALTCPDGYREYTTGGYMWILFARRSRGGSGRLEAAAGGRAHRWRCGGASRRASRRRADGRAREAPADAAGAPTGARAVRTASGRATPRTRSGGGVCGAPTFWAGAAAKPATLLRTISVM